ncbi:MAG: hypothetical protein IPP15_20935 [Saprospiraceae bacterium]|uniref:Uncharacterized protein n=1 Tax=Candidatus Opimibacter skivensis TaxID=2982028 RepID=A0A9D7SX02_9BACT|nr:hypothetical protein [Candidatus Opimibacter skivensis]
MKFAFLFFILFFFFAACTTSAVTPTRNSRQVIDSIYNHQTVFLQSNMDSLCAARHEVYFKIVVDSIMNARQMEMNNLVK